MENKITIDNSTLLKAIIINWSEDKECFTVIPKNSIDFVCKRSIETIVITDTRSMTPWDIEFHKVLESEYTDFTEMVTIITGYIKT